MHALRNAVFLARLVLAWFVLSLGVAVASPLVKPQAVELVCSGPGAMKLLLKDAGDGRSPVAGHALDCPLCLSLDAPPIVAPLAGASAAPMGHVLQSIPSARIAALTAAPPPARGPPATAHLI